MNELDLNLLLERLEKCQLVKDKWWQKTTRIDKEAGFSRVPVKKDEVIIKEKDLKLLVRLVREDLFMLKYGFGE